MQRRELLKSLPLTFAGLAFAPTVTAIWSKATDSGLFETTEEKDLAAITEAILPETNTPGAIAAGVPAFIIVAVNNLLSPDDQMEFHKNLQAFSKNSRQKYSKAFHALNGDQQFDYLKTLVEAEDEFFNTVKDLTLFGYFTSEVGMTSALHYDPIPGKYEPCVKVDDNTRAAAQYF